MYISSSASDVTFLTHPRRGTFHREDGVGQVGAVDAVLVEVEAAAGEDDVDVKGPSSVVGGATGEDISRDSPRKNTRRVLLSAGTFTPWTAPAFQL